MDLATQRVERQELAVLQEPGAGVSYLVHILLVINDKARRLRQGARGEEEDAEQQNGQDGGTRLVLVGPRFAQNAEAGEERPQPGGEEDRGARFAHPGDGFGRSVVNNLVVDLNGDERGPAYYQNKARDGQ